MTASTTRLERKLSEAIAASDPGFGKGLEREPDSYLRLAGATAEAHAIVARMLSAAVSSARSAGHTWEAIGRSLGMSRQAAQQRFGEAIDEPSPAAPAARRLLSPVTAFDEMEALEELGRFGWHSVEFGPLYHVLERSDQQWAHRRVLVWSREPRRLEAAGWHRIGTRWFPWAYYARPTGRAALREPDERARAKSESGRSAGRP